MTKSFGNVKSRKMVIMVRKRVGTNTEKPCVAGSIPALPTKGEQRLPILYILY